MISKLPGSFYLTLRKNMADKVTVCKGFVIHLLLLQRKTIDTRESKRIVPTCFYVCMYVYTLCNVFLLSAMEK